MQLALKAQDIIGHGSEKSLYNRYKERIIGMYHLNFTKIKPVKNQEPESQSLISSQLARLVSLLPLSHHATHRNFPLISETK